MGRSVLFPSTRDLLARQASSLKVSRRGRLGTVLSPQAIYSRRGIQPRKAALPVIHRRLRWPERYKAES